MKDAPLDEVKKRELLGRINWKWVLTQESSPLIHFSSLELLRFWGWGVGVGGGVVASEPHLLPSPPPPPTPLPHHASSPRTPLQPAPPSNPQPPPTRSPL